MNDKDVIYMQCKRPKQDTKNLLKVCSSKTSDYISLGETFYCKLLL